MLPAVGLFVVAGARRGWPWQDRWLLAAAYALALLWPLGGFIGFVPFALVVWLAPLVLLGRGPFGRFPDAAWNRSPAVGVIEA